MAAGVAVMVGDGVCEGIVTPWDVSVGTEVFTETAVVETTISESVESSDEGVFGTASPDVHAFNAMSNPTISARRQSQENRLL